jgi:hypothetical protein
LGDKYGVSSGWARAIYLREEWRESQK